MARQPWKTADIADKIYKDFYFNDPNGLAGNEDVGQMSGWYILSSLGFYQSEPATPRFWFGKPAFRSAAVKVPGGMFNVTAENLSEDNKYIQSITLNGDEYNLPYIEYKDIYRGGNLVFKMGSEKKVWY